MKFMSEGVYVDCVECFAHVLQSSTTVIVRSGGLFSVKPVLMVLFMLCSAVLVEWLLLKWRCVGCCL